MPTGYTAILQEQPDLPFADFAMICARAMGACIMQRDDASDAPVNMDEKPSSYHEQSKENSINALRDAEERSLAIWRVLLKKEIAESKASCNKHCAETSRWREAYWKMLAEVLEWNPPTDEHIGLKEFMRQQLMESIEWDCKSTLPDYYEDELKKLLAMTVAEFKTQTIQNLRRDVEYHAENLRKETERVEARNRWKRLLVDSLK